MKRAYIPILAVLGLVLSVPKLSLAASEQAAETPPLPTVNQISNICSACEIREKAGADQIHSELDRIVPIFCLDRALCAAEPGYWMDDFVKPPFGPTVVPSNWQLQDRQNLFTYYTRSQPVIAEVVGVKFDLGGDPYDQWRKLKGYITSSSACRRQIAFTYPEHYLLLPNEPYAQRVCVASERVCKEWGKALQIDGRWWEKPSDPSCNEKDLLTTTRDFDFLTRQPQMSAVQWGRLKRAVRRRWTTQFGESRKHYLEAMLNQDHTLDRVRGPKPSLSIHDMRGFTFGESFQLVGCVLDDVDLWNARFEKCRLPQAQFNGARICDVEFTRAILTEARITGAEEKYGPTYSTFQDCKLNQSLWSNCRPIGNVFHQCDFTGSRFENCEFGDTLFLSCALNGTVFDKCSFGEGCHFIDCKLANVDFGDTVLREDLFAPIKDVTFARTHLFDKQKCDCERERIGYIARMSASWVHKGDRSGQRRVLRWILASSEKARIPAWRRWWNRLFGFPSEVRYKLCQEEDVKGKSNAFRAVMCQVVESYRRSGMMERYRQEWARMNYRRKETGLPSWIWQQFEGATSEFSTSPGRFFGVFILALIAYRLARISLTPAGQKTFVHWGEGWGERAMLVILGSFVATTLALKWWLLWVVSAAIAMMWPLGVAPIIIAIAWRAIRRLCGGRHRCISLGAFTRRLFAPLFTPHEDLVGAFFLTWSGYEVVRLLSFWWGS